MTTIKILADRQWKGIDKRISAILREPITFTSLPKAMPIGKGKRVHEYMLPIDFKFHDVGISFNYEERNVINRKHKDAKISYLNVPIHIDEVDLDASGSDGIMNLLTQAEVDGRSYIMELIEKIIFHGNTKRGSVGMCNYTGLATSASANTWTTAGDFIKDVEIAISSLRSNHILQPYEMLATPGIKAELRGNTLTNIGNEWKEFREVYMEGKNPVIGSFISTDAIYNGTLTTATQCFLLFKSNIDCMYIAESYPLHRAKIPRKYWEGDIEYALRWAGGFIPKNPKAVYYMTSGDTGSVY